MPRMKEVELSFETPDSLFGVPLPKIGFKGTMTPDDTERNFAWAVYVELVTRITTARLGETQGSLREALNSFYQIFTFVRAQLHSAGPDIGRRGNGDLPVAASALWMLNGVLRPVLAEWHPRLKRYEESVPAGTGAFVHEAAWPDGPAMRTDLEAVRRKLVPFCQLFEQMCSISPSLVQHAG